MSEYLRFWESWKFKDYRKENISVIIRKILNSTENFSQKILICPKIEQLLTYHFTRTVNCELSKLDIPTEKFVC